MSIKFNQTKKDKLFDILTGTFFYAVFIAYYGLALFTNIWGWLLLLMYILWLYSVSRSGLILNEEHLTICHYLNTNIDYEDIERIEVEKSNLKIITKNKKSYNLNFKIEKFSELTDEIKKRIP